MIPNMIKNKDSSIDNIRWITVVLVVIYHVIYMFNGVQTIGVIGPFSEVQYQDIYQYIVYPWFMLLLFVISGMSSRFYLNNHSDKEFIKSRTTKLLVPSTIGLFVFWWIMGYYNMAISGALESMSAVPKPIFFLIMSVSGTGPLWYIQLLWVFSLILVIIRKIEKDKLYVICKKVNVPILIALALVIWGAAQVLNTPIIVVYRFGIYGAGFLFGYFIFSHDEVMEKLEKWWLVFSFAAVVIGVTFVITFWGATYTDHVVLDTFLCNLYSWIATLAILSFMKKWGNFDNSFSRFMSRKSWGLYLFHYLPLSICAWYLHTYTTLPAIAMYICVGIAAFAGAFILYEIISRIPFLKWCICGIRGKKMFADNLMELRKYHNMSQEELAEKIGVSRQTLSKYETGESLPDIEKCKTIADVFGVTVDDLICYEKSDGMGLGLPPKGKHIFGMVKVGDKGQIVIPAKARKIFNINPGDNLIILGDESQGIALIKEKGLLELLHSAGSSMHKH